MLEWAKKRVLGKNRCSKRCPKCIFFQLNLLQSNFTRTFWGLTCGLCHTSIIFSRYVDKNTFCSCKRNGLIYFYENMTSKVCDVGLTATFCTSLIKKQITDCYFRVMANVEPALIVCKDSNIIFVTYFYNKTSVNEQCEQHLRYG